MMKDTMKNTPKNDQPPERRDQILPPIRVTKSELAAIKTNAAQAGISTSEIQRRAGLNGGVIVRDAAVDVEATRLLLSIGRDLRGATRNLNQLTKSAHIHGSADVPNLNRVLTDIESQLSKIGDAVDRLLP